MPPWHADPRHGHFTNDRRLTRDEIDTLAAWVDAGMPKGDAKDLPKPIDWPEGWMHGKPDLVFEMPEEFEVPATGVVPYKNWIIDPKLHGGQLGADRRVPAGRAGRGASHRRLHHEAGAARPGRRPTARLSILVGWAPGDLGLVLPPDTGLRVPKGSRLRLEMHYTPNGTAAKDRSAVGITFAKKPPKYELFLNEFANMAFEVAAARPALQGRGDASACPPTPA